GMVLLLTAVAVLGLTLYAHERARYTKQKREKDDLVAVLMNRLETATQGEGRTPNTNITSFRISATELAVLTGRELDGAETPIVLGLHLNPMQPPEVLQHLAPLVNYLQTGMATGSVAFEVQLYT